MTIPPYIVDHRYAQSEIRHALLEHLDLYDNNIRTVAEKSGLSVEHLTGVCLGRVGLTYRDMAKLVKALRCDATELFVTIHWVDCGQGYSLEEPAGCLDRENQKLLAGLQARGKVLTSVWPEKTP
jgi:hypothetical protein